MKGSGYLLYDKPVGVTSFKALDVIKKKFPGRRIGHTGTLDSFASGLLVVMIGSYSRISPWFTGLDKWYEASICFGTETDTLDPSGDIVSEKEAPSQEALIDALGFHRGRIEQVPPRYSALHVAGARASDLAVKGIDFELAPRTVMIYSLDLKSYKDGVAKVAVHCSSGTYIRSLARDIAKACGSCAHLCALRRSSVGPFSVDDVDSEMLSMDCLRVLNPKTARIMGLAVAYADSKMEKCFTNGLPSILEELDLPKAIGKDSPQDVAIFSHGETFLGIVSVSSGKKNYKMVLPAEVDLQ
jgi:tRNA pseudouridine55 synthase